MSEEDRSDGNPPDHREAEKPARNTEKPGCLAAIFSIAGAAFLLSFALAAQSWLQVISRASITVLGPTSVYVYRSGLDDTYPLALAVQIPMANASEDYSDFLTEAYLEVEGINRRFPITMIIQPTLFLTTEAAVGSCERSPSNCVNLNRLAIVEREWDHVSRVPAGDAHNLYYSFEITCLTRDCQQVADYRTALQLLSAQRKLNFKVYLRFHGDGLRVVECDIPRFQYATILGRHWQSATCSTSGSTDLRPWYQRWAGLG